MEKEESRFPDPCIPGTRETLYTCIAVKFKSYPTRV